MRTKGALNKDRSTLRDQLVHCRATNATKIYITFINSNTQYKSDADVIEAAVKLMYDQISAQPVKQEKKKGLSALLEDEDEPAGKDTGKTKSMFKKQLKLPVQENKKQNGPAIHPARKAAILHIREEVIYGTSFENIKQSRKYTGGPKESIGIHGTKIIISRLNGKEVHYEYSLREIYNVVKDEMKKVLTLPIPKELKDIRGIERFTYGKLSADRQIFINNKGEARFMDSFYYWIKDKFELAPASWHKRGNWVKDKTYYGVPAGHASVNIYLVK